ncbi:MAG: hypothetical protein R3B96_00020 [Pirellulaceae bacterium]
MPPRLATAVQSSLAVESAWSSPEIRGVVVVAGFLCGVVFLVYVVLTLRNLLLGPTSPANPVDHLTDFEEMVDAGTLSNFELRRVRGAIASQTKELDQLRQTGKDSSPEPRDEPPLPPPSDEWSREGPGEDTPPRCDDGVTPNDQN